MIHRTSLLGTAGIVLLGVVVFALPLVATGIVLAITMLLSRAAWSAGVPSRRRNLLIIPLLAALGFAVALVGSGFFPPIYRPVPQNAGYPSGTAKIRHFATNQTHKSPRTSSAACERHESVKWSNCQRAGRVLPHDAQVLSKRKYAKNI